MSLHGSSGSVAIGAGGVSYLVVYALTSLPIVSVMPAVVVATLPRAYYGRKRSRRLIEVQQAWPDGLRDLISSVRSGASLPTAVEGLATFGPGAPTPRFQEFHHALPQSGIRPGAGDDQI